MSKLDGKLAVITGGNSGIGLATAKVFQENGARVVINARNETRLTETQALAEKPFDDILVADVGKVADLENFYQNIGEKHGKIDVLFLNAGVAYFMPMEAVDEASFDKQFNINVKGVFFGVQKALPYLNDGASIILNSSVVNQIGMPNSNIYAATKAAVRSFARSLSSELVNTRGIRINVIAPGPIETPIYDKMGFTEEQSNAMAGQIISQVPMARFGKAEEIAKVALFYASDDSSFVVGTEIQVDGGMVTL